MDFYELATIKNAAMQAMIRERDYAIDLEECYRAKCEGLQALGDSNTAAWYEHLANCEFEKALSLTHQIIKLVEEMGL